MASVASSLKARKARSWALCPSATICRSGTKVLKEPVSTYMTRAVVTAREADTIDRLMSEMTTHRFRHMPVVERGRLIGLVSIGDVVKMRIAEAEMEAAAMREYIATG